MAYQFHDARIGEMAAVAALLDAKMLAGAPTVTSISPTGGPTKGGTVVTVTGTNFENGNLTGGTLNGNAFTNAELGLVITGATTCTLVMPADTSVYAATVTPGTGVALEMTNSTGTSTNGVTYDYWDQTFTTPSGQAPKGVPDTKRQVRGYYNLGPSYPTGGFTISPGLVGLTQVDEVASSVSLVGRPCAWVPAATAGAGGKLKVFAASDTEVASGTDLHADSVFLIIWGK